MSADAQPPTRQDQQVSVTASNEPQPLTPDQVAKTMEYTIYGVPIGVMGEDCDDGYVSVTTDRRRAIAAAWRYWRSDGNGRTKFNIDGPLWVQFWDHCGCLPHEPDPDADHDDCQCDHSGLPPCQEDTWSWIYEKSTPDAVNAVCVYRIEVD